jgi:hypothetical protein
LTDAVETLAQEIFKREHPDRKWLHATESVREEFRSRAHTEILERAFEADTKARKP